MARWETGTRERLQAAALERFAEHGFDRTTVAEIATTAGLTERTFFRYFADKREVLFDGQDHFEQAFLDGLDGAPTAEPMALVRASLTGAAAFFPDERRPWARTRQAVISSHPGLQERELLKLSGLAVTLTGALRDRGMDAVTSALAAESTMTVFRTTFAAWIEDGQTRSFTELQDAVLDRLHTLVAPA
ncbi:TetR family transcriptional regulator [Tersicoccus sp. MR15.9]|uniref:TetR family transcriptional regulator n=1 Tax=Tersicoccus mangrovi TaxID=3121635 RepID=UPI002FE64B0E